MPMIAAVLVLAALQGDPVSEKELKAAFLFNFARHVEWPADAFPKPDAPFVVTIVGRDGTADAMERLLSGKQLQGRPTVLRRSPQGDDLAGSHLVFVPDAEKDKAEAVLQALKGSRTLTVGESPGFIPVGGVMNFFTEDKKLRFEVSLAAAKRSGLSVSSKLLRIGRVLKGDE